MQTEKLYTFNNYELEIIYRALKVHEETLASVSTSLFITDHQIGMQLNDLTDVKERVKKALIPNGVTLN